MRVHYTGVPSGLNPTKEKLIQARLTRIGKMLDKKGEKEGHVILTAVRKERKAEITVNHHHHAFAGKATAKDDFTALASAIDKLEKQIIKSESKWRDSKRNGVEKGEKAEAIPAPDENVVKVHRVTPKAGRKPMTVDEAVLTINNKQSYLVFRDVDTDKTAIVVRRLDGNFDMIELE